jgi:hypothetical protein
LAIRNGDLLVFKGPKGVAVIEVTHTTDCRASYRWRHASERGGPKTSGHGTLFEQYGRRPTERDGTRVADLGGELFITAGPYRVEWSCSAANAGWIYGYRTAELEAYLLSGVRFADFRL